MQLDGSEGGFGGSMRKGEICEISAYWGRNGPKRPTFTCPSLSRTTSTNLRKLLTSTLSNAQKPRNPITGFQIAKISARRDLKSALFLSKQQVNSSEG